MTLDSTEPLNICRCVKRALEGQTPGTLRAFSFAVDSKAKEIRLRAHFGEAPSEQDLQDISIAETEIVSDFSGPYVISTSVEIVPRGKKLLFLRDGIAYLREDEAGTLCDGAIFRPAMVRRGSIARSIWSLLSGWLLKLRRHVPRSSRPPGSKETFENDGEVIGRYRYAHIEKWAPTTRGLIHYGPEGLHIIPARPIEDAAMDLDPVEVCHCVQRALLGQTPASLRAYSFRVDLKAREILLRAHFARPPSWEEREDISIVESEIMADFIVVIATEIRSDREIVAPGAALSFHATGIAYLCEGEASSLAGQI